MKKIKLLLAGLVLSAMTTVLNAAGPHDGVTCLGCHSTHFAVDDKLFAVANKNLKNPLNSQLFDGMVAKNCLGCHQLPQFGGAGIRPIHLHASHPIGMVPNSKIASVPENMLKGGRLDCVSCHEAHPSNQNFMYLRVNTGTAGENIQNLCATCHSAKVDMKAAGLNSEDDIKVFSAMDQEKGAGFFNRNEVRIENKTKSYIKPLGKNNENDILPNYQNPPSWVYSPEIDPYAEDKTKK